MACRICADQDAPPSHPDYPNPELGDEWHGQYNPDSPQAVYDALSWPTERQLEDWNIHNDHADGWDSDHEYAEESG